LLKKYSVEMGLPFGDRLSSHAFRRGMAQEILDLGGSLGTLLKAGDWCSSAFLKYLRHQQTEDVAAGAVIINLSDSEAEQ
jgi:hypothetical protein